MALIDYLNRRRAEIDAQMKALKAELAEIRIAEKALAPPSVEVEAAASQAGVRPGSIKAWVLKALEGEIEGLDTETLIWKIENTGGPSVPRSSMTPQLSRLKNDDGLIHQVGRNWRLGSEVLTDEFNSIDEAPSFGDRGAFGDDLEDLI